MTFMGIVRPEDLDLLVFIDETGSNAAMAPLYGRAPRSKRAVGRKPKNKDRQTLTMLGALSTDGLVAMMTVSGGACGDVFLGFVRDVLVPKLRPGQVVIMDNLAAHKVAGVREAIEAAGCWLLYLPPYSPQFNPIELCWNKVKHMLRKAAARSFDAINGVLKDVMSSISPKNALSWFNHCGYGLQAQPH